MDKESIKALLTPDWKKALLFFAGLVLLIPDDLASRVCHSAGPLNLMISVPGMYILTCLIIFIDNRFIHKPPLGSPPPKNLREFFNPDWTKISLPILGLAIFEVAEPVANKCPSVGSFGLFIQFLLYEVGIYILACLIINKLVGPLERVEEPEVRRTGKVTLKFPVETEGNKIGLLNMLFSTSTNYPCHSINTVYMNKKFIIRYLYITYQENKFPLKEWLVDPKSVDILDEDVLIDIDLDKPLSGIDYDEYHKKYKSDEVVYEKYITGKAGEDVKAMGGLGEGLTAEFPDTDKLFNVKDALLSSDLQKIEAFIVKGPQGKEVRIPSNVCEFDKKGFRILVNEKISNYN